MAGRLVREAGDLLCTGPDHGSMGLSWGRDRRGDRSRQVTCRACLRIAGRFRPEV